jgi:branched-chain amino acid transport system permease protein
MHPHISTVYLASTRIRIIELLPWVAALGAFFLLPEFLSLGARILIYILLVLSLDLVVGYAGIITLGHAAFFGIGAYTAGILSVHFGVKDPLLQLAAAGIIACLIGLGTGLYVLRTSGLALIMLTLAISALCFELANKATSLTGGTDGLSGVTLTPILGAFRFDLWGKTAYLYTLAVLFVVWWLVRMLLNSPFGASLAGIRDNRTRMEAIGAPVRMRLVQVYSISAAIAGLAGALLTQTNQFVGLNTLGFELSGEILVMLVLGGVGRLYGAFIGTAAYLIAQDQLAKQFPEDWYLGVGILLVTVTIFARGGLLGALDTLMARLRGAKHP